MFENWRLYVYSPHNEKYCNMLERFWWEKVKGYFVIFKFLNLEVNTHVYVIT